MNGSSTIVASAQALLPAAATEDSLSSSPVIMRLPVVHLHGARLHAIRESQCVEAILDALDSGYGGSVSTMNLDHLRRFARYRDHAALYGKANILTADGMPLIWASNLRGTPLPERVTGSNLIFSLSEGAGLAGRSVFFLGGAPEAAQKTATVLAQRYPGLAVAGVSSLPTEAGGDREEWEEIALMLVAAKPDIVFVALGSPKQERLIESLRLILPSSWWIGVGIAFSFVAGQIPRAPLWMQRAGLEWLHRLLKEPRRLARRYLVQGLPFALALLGRALFDRLALQSDPRDP